MRERFEAMGIKDGHIAPKGTWGSEIIKEIINLRPDLILVKSHYSSFSPGHSFIYQLGNDEIERYLSLPASKDAELKASGIKTMLDYFEAASKVNESIGKLIDENLANGGVVSLDAYLKAKEIDTLIIIGASTHVCIDSTVAGASERSYRVYMPIDAVASEDHEKHFVYASNHGVFKAQLTTTNEILSAIENEQM
jgi:nicotinamidase-related amidase